MVIGDIAQIDLSTSSFERIMRKGCLYVDKTRLIENFLTAPSDIHLVARQRRLGKSLNMDTLRCFLTDRVDLRHLFKGLYIESSPVWEKAHSAPAFKFDFKSLMPETYREQIIDQMDAHVYSLVDPQNLNGRMKRKYEKILNDPLMATECLFFLTELAYELTGKRSYLLIDEYDKLLAESFDSDRYEEMRAFETTLLSTALKGNDYLEKALLTGVMRVSHESMLSGINNIVTFDVFNDSVYTADYGLTDAEMEELRQLAGFDLDEARTWYNGIRIGGQTIYNTYSVMSYLTYRCYECYWGRSDTLSMIASMLNDQRKPIMAELLNGNVVEVEMNARISLEQLFAKKKNDAFFSLLVQAGYLALIENSPNKGTALVSIPNCELMTVWKLFILGSLYDSASHMRTLFDNVHDLKLFAEDVEYFLSDRLSYHDLAVYDGLSPSQKQFIVHVKNSIRH